MTAKNRITVFSNGVADFVRTYRLNKGVTSDKETKISLPVKRSNIADVLSSLSIFGDVELVSPPSFSPVSGNNTLDISVQNVFEDIATKLSGSSVVVERYNQENIEGTLMGIHAEENSAGGETYKEKFLILLTKSGMSRTPFKIICSIKFTDAAVQSEIDKALQRNFQKIKPTSTFIDLTLKPNGVEEVFLQYTVPSPAWKTSYRLKLDSDECTLKGYAIVDNDTDEDWKDFELSVVTGEPITFSTDLAESKTPKRQHVNVVKQQAIGAVEVENFIVPSNVMMTACSSMGASPTATRSAKTLRHTNTESMASEGCLSDAMTVDASTKEVGDFSVFTSKNPVTIPANQSALIPIFETSLREAENVLHFNSQNHPTRAYRSVKFKNETEHALGRGVCSFTTDGIYAGSGILPATKQGEDQLIPYALETGVRFLVTDEVDYNKTRVKVSEGVLYTQNIQKRKTTVEISNSKDEAFKLYYEDNSVLNGTIKTEFPKEKTASGHRLFIKLGAKEKKTFVIEETSVIEQNYQINGIQTIDWYMNQFIVGRNLKDFDDVVSIFNRIGKATARFNVASNEITKLTTRQNRTRLNISSVGTGVEAQADLATARAELFKLEKDILKLEQEQTQITSDLENIRKELVEALEKKNTDWVG